MKKQKNRHYKIMLTALGLSIFIINSCRKMELSVSSDVVTTEKFFKISPNINPSVKKVVDKLKSINNNKEFVSNFADKEGFAIWDKAMVTVTNHKKSGRFSTSRNSSDSSNGYDTTITIPVVLNSTVYVNAAIVATLNDSISLSLFRGRDYSKLPYGNHGVDTFTAEKYAVQFMKLEKMVFGTNSFLLTDHNLFSYLLNNNNGRTSLLPGSFDITMSAGDCVDWINILYNNPDMIISNGTITCVGFEQGGGPIDTHMPPIINTGDGGSTGGSGGGPVGGGGNNTGSGSTGSSGSGVRPPNGLGWVPIEDDMTLPLWITDSLPTPCFKAALQKISSGSQNTFFKEIYNTFDTSSSMFLNIQEVDSIPGAYAATDQPFQSSVGIYINIDLSKLELKKCSQEFISYTLIHEVAHAAMHVNIISWDTTNTQHENMISTYLDKIATSLTASYSTLTLKEAYSICFFGFKNTIDGNTADPRFLDIMLNQIRAKLNDPNLSSSSLNTIGKDFARNGPKGLRNCN